MIETIGHIKNPLTVISIFAGIAEISGTAILPFIESANQSTYIWFLMLFPPFLVGVFFATLNWNHKVLYAPSDYQNEDNFTGFLQQSTRSEQNIKLSSEVKEFVSDPPSTEAATTPPEQTTSQSQEAETLASEPSVDTQLKGNETRRAPREANPSKPAEVAISNYYKYKMSNTASPFELNRLTADIQLTKTLAINRTTRLTGMTFQRDLKLVRENGRDILFDGAHLRKDQLDIVEVKIQNNAQYSGRRIEQALNKCLSILQAEDRPLKLILHLVIVVIEANDIEMQKLKENIDDHASRFVFKTFVQVISLNELESESPPSDKHL